MATKAEKFIHIRFEHFAAKQCKRDMLSTEIDLVRMNKRLRMYIDSRMKELDIKADLDKKLRSLKLDLGRLQNIMPGVKIPKLLKPGSPGYEEPEEERPAEKGKKVKGPKIKEITEQKGPETDDLDAQLQDIQKQLDALA